MILDILVSDAMAQAAPAAQNPLVSLLPMVLIFVVFYFLLIRPQQKRTKQHKEMVSNIAVGDEVVTAGGFYGVITEVDDQTVGLKVADNVIVKVQKASVSQTLPKGSI